ncbi:MAG: YvcK family protein [archaeon]|nr:MAG: YvcK family protein [archaeon]
MKIVTFNGGKGGYILLLGLKKLDADITAVFSAFDSGGSTGKLRKEFGGIALGDLRRGFLALGSDEGKFKIMKEFLTKRFQKDSSLNGHNLGNLMLFSLNIQKDPKSLEKAKQIFGLKEKHNILPPSFDDCNLYAELEDGSIIEGETNIDVPKHNTELKIRRVFLKPDAVACEETLKEIETADAIVIGPGDLYSSIIQNFLVKGIPEAIQKSRAKKIYVANTMTKLGETENFKVSNFVKEIEKYIGCSLDCVIVNDNNNLDKKNVEDLHLSFVECDENNLNKMNIKTVIKKVVNKSRPDTHNSEKLAEAIMEVIG